MLTTKNYKTSIMPPVLYSGLNSKDLKGGLYIWSKIWGEIKVSKTFFEVSRQKEVKVHQISNTIVTFYKIFTKKI